VEFLVRIRQDWAALRERSDLAELIAEERRVGAALMSEGHLRDIWRLPGQHANIGIWCAADATALVELLDRLPLRPWLDAHVTALAAHELQQPARSAATSSA